MAGRGPDLLSSGLPNRRLRPGSRRNGGGSGWSTPRRRSPGRKLVLEYLARYTHRVAIANSRLVALEDNGQVTFR